jgi:hypothetical protein
MRTKNGYSFFKRDSGGSLNIVSYHPRNSQTWHWCLSLVKLLPGQRRLFKIDRAEVRTNQWHDYYCIFWLCFMFSRQDYHLQKPATHEHGSLQ